MSMAMAATWSRSRRSEHTAPRPSFACTSRALPLLPGCRELESRQYRNEEELLGTCGVLRGDLLAAAEVLTLANAFRYLDGAESDVADMRGLFGYDHARIDWAGEVGTDRDAAAFWLRKLRETKVRQLLFREVTGETGDRVLARGVLERWVGEADRRLEAAPVEQLRVREGDRYRIERATVGAFGPVPKP
jgi:hypothetical protein